jgi:hypothetical protein
MRSTTCESCGASSVPLNDTLTIDGMLHCSRCIEHIYDENNPIECHTVTRNVDPTVCSICSRDYGDEEPPKIGHDPVCGICRDELNAKAFPPRVKAFFGLIVAVVAIAFLVNWRFYNAYQSVLDSAEAMEQIRYSDAAMSLQQAFADVPEVEFLHVLSTYYQGLDHLSKDKDVEALKAFEFCEGKMPEEYPLESLLKGARIGAAFDRGQYDKYLAYALAELSLDSTSAMNHATVASAHACLYAKRGIESDKLISQDYIKKARSLAGDDQSIDLYCNAVEYRLHFRRIVSFRTFEKLYPQGWDSSQVN